MKIKFTKMHGCGNDYVYINGFTEKIPQEQKPDFVRQIKTERSMELRKDIRRFADESPEIAAQIVKNLLKGGDNDG